MAAVNDNGRLFPFPTVNRALLVLTKVGKAAIRIPALSRAHCYQTDISFL